MDGFRCRRQDRRHDDLHERRYAEPAGRDRFHLVCGACAAQRTQYPIPIVFPRPCVRKARLHCGRIPHAFFQSSEPARHRTARRQARRHPAQPSDCIERHAARYRGLQHPRQRMADGEGASDLSVEREGAVADRRKMMDTFDYVIVGAGSAGCVLTNRLSEDQANSICVLEAGPRDWHPYIHLPAGFIKTFHMKSINWAYQQEPGAYTGGRSIHAPRGMTLGGSSSINGHIYNRGQRQDFDTWAQLGNRGWGYPDVLPYFKRLERRVGEGEDAFRGRDGNLTVTTMDWRDPLCEAFMAGAISLGIPRNPDYNGAIQEGVSYAQRTIQNGLRVSAATAFLRPAMKRPNVHVRTHAHATGIVFEGKRAIGVRYVKGGKGGTPTEVRAAKEVILAGGTYNSPQLLQLSGIGSPDLLASLGIEVRHALAGVVEGLQDHYARRAVARAQHT